MENQNIGIFVGTVVGLFPMKVVELLKNNGYVSDEKMPKTVDEIVDLTFTALQTSTEFRVDFIDLYLNNEEAVKATASDSVFLNITSTAPTTSSTPASGSGFNWGGLVTTVVGGGIGIFTGDQANKTAREQARATVEANKLQLEAERLRLQGKALEADTALALAKSGGQPKSNTALYIGLGVGALLLVGLLVVVLKKK
jgi:hypothetical protein